ncbi:MAG: hypothetical protein NTZ59_06220 [Bacteroidetes bacterium]|nr:hypothetical protein [Bacteroidota bacterium]
MINDEFAEKIITHQDVKRLYKLIGQSDFIDLLLSNEMEKIVIKKKFQTNETFETIGKSIGMSKTQTIRLYENAIRKIKQKIRRFIGLYIEKKTDKNYSVKTQIENKIHIKSTNHNNNRAVLLSSILGSNMKLVNILNNSGIFSLGDLIKYSRKELLLLPMMGLNKMQEIECILNHYNLKLLVK